MPGFTANLSRRHMLQIMAALGLGHLITGCADEPDTPAQTPITGPVDVPSPLRTTVTRWGTDPYALGSYSYLATAATPADRRALGAAARPLFFAGEATSSTYPATVHGALLSGRAAARQIIDSGATSAVIVGAGAAGMGAAEILGAAGVSVRLLEARDRIGGRVWTDTSWGMPLELGASWIHGEKRNPLTKLAHTISAQRFVTDYDNHLVRDAEGKVVAEDDFPEDFRQVTLIEHEFAADVADLSPEASDEGSAFRGDDVLLADGYLNILQQLIPDGLTPELRWVVNSIHVSDTTATVVGEPGTVTAEAVLVTVPLGVLKAQKIRFEPPLDADRLGAIDRLGMGLLNKVYLEFPEIFWEPEADLLGYIGPQRGYFAEWVNLAKFTGKPILLGFNAGSAAAEIERLSDAETIELALTALQKMYSA